MLTSAAAGGSFRPACAPVALNDLAARSLSV